MNPKKMFVVMTLIVITICFGVIPTASPQLKDVKQINEADLYHQFGRSVSGGYDLNGDGKPDLIVGAPYLDLPGKPNAGRVYIFSGADGDTICVIDGESSGDLFGYSVSSSGDLNNDSKPDFIVGAPGYGSNTGKVYVYSGQTFSLLHTFSGEATGDKFGFSVSGAGNANGDVCNDIIIGAPGADWADLTNCGKIYLYKGCYWTLYWDDNGQVDNDSLGYSVAGGCDVNNDGYDDIIVGVPYFDGILKTDNGRAYIESGYDRTLLCWSFGEQSYDHLGWSVSCVGFFDADNDADFVIGAPGHNDNTGKAYVLEHAPLLPEPHIRILCNLDGGATGDQFGWSVSGAGDVNNDGRADVIIGSPGVSSNKGKAYIYLGDGCSAQCTVLGRNQGDRFGYSVASAGDVAAGDNKDDVIIGAPSANISGKAYVQSGVDCSEIFQFYPSSPFIEVTSPGDGDRWCVDSYHDITWTPIWVNHNVQIEYSTNAGSSWIPVVSSAPNNGHYENWSVPNTPSSTCLMRICDVSGSPCGTSDTFAIAKLTITSPNGGEFWCVGHTCSITWDTCCGYDYVNIKYSTDGGGIWNTVPGGSYTDNDGVHPWTIPNTSSSRCLIEICDVDGNPCDTSNNYFFIPRPWNIHCDPAELSPASYVVGDANGDKTVDQGDIIYLINYLYKGGSLPIPLASGDVNSDSTIDLKDIIYLIRHLYIHESSPPWGDHVK